MTPAEFDAIKARRQANYPDADLGVYEVPLVVDIDALIAEVEKLRALNQQYGAALDAIALAALRGTR